jgi:hypothetical protein
MTSYSWASPISGDWNTGTLWSGGTPPNLVPNAIDANATIDVANATTLYTVTIAPTESVTLASLQLNEQGDGTNSSPYIGAVLEMDGTLAFTGSGTIGGSLQSQLLSNGGTFVNVGNLAPFTQGSGTVLFEGSNPFYVQDELQSLGTVIVDTASIGELIQNTLTDGIYSAVGDTSALDLGGTRGGLTPSITKMQGPPDQTAQYGFQGWTELQMNGPAAVINEWNGTAYVGVETTLNDVGGGGLLEALSGRGYTTANAMTLESRSLMWVQGGTTSINGGLVLSTGTNSAIGGVFEGFGTITNGVTNNGTMVALGGTLDIVGALTGTGVVQFDKDYQNFIQFGPTQGTIVTSPTGAVLQVGTVFAGQTIVMNGDDTLDINSPSSFAGTIQANAGDQIVLGGITATSAVLNNGTLVVFNGTETVASLALAGTYAGEHFTVTGSTVAVAAGNIVPTIGGTVAGQTVRDTGTITPFAKVTIADANVSQTETVAVALSTATNGTLTNLGGGTYNATTGVYTDIGSAAAVTTALNGLVFIPTAGEVPLGQTITTGFTITDTDTALVRTTDTTTSVVATGAAGDPRADILFQNVSGQLALWQTDGSTITAASVITSNPGSSWVAMGSGAFYTGDSSDVVLQNQNDGSVAVLRLQGTTFVSQTTLTANPGTSWHIAGTGDYYGDGNTDILWQNSSGSVALWDMNGATIVQAGVVATNPGPTWSIKGTGNFYGDGNTDIVWQNNDGSVALWDMKGTTIVQAGIVAANPGPSWHIEATGDFYGDGNTDIVWQNNNGSVALWDMKGTTIVQAGMVAANPGPSWHIEATGDFNNDGKTDIVWQSDSGQVATWQMNGTTIAGAEVLANPGTSWAALGSDENMRFIYSTSANEKLVATPVTPEEFVFTSFAAGEHTIAGFSATQDIIELSSAQFANFAAVQDATKAIAGGAMINLGNSSSLLLPGVDPTLLHVSSFALA